MRAHASTLQVCERTQKRAPCLRHAAQAGKSATSTPRCACALTEMGVALPVATSHTKKPGDPGLAPASRWPCASGEPRAGGGSGYAGGPG